MSKKNTTKANNKLEQNITFIAIPALMLFVLLIIIVYLSRPIADDFARLFFMSRMTIIEYVKSSYMGTDGRYSNALFMAVFLKFFGFAGLRIAIIFYISALIGSVYMILKQLFSRNKPKTLLLSTTTIVALTLCLLPSVFDILGWFNSASIYLAGISMTLFFVAIVIFVHNKVSNNNLYSNKYKIVLFAVVAILGIFVQGFVESLSLTLFLCSSVMLLMAFMQRNKNLAALYLVTSFALGVGLIFMAKAPGTITRKHLQSVDQYSVKEVLKDSTPSYEYLSDIVFSKYIIVVMVLGAVWHTLLVRSKDKINLKGFTIFIGFLAIWVVISITLTVYGRSMEGGRIPFRAASMVVVPLIIGLSYIFAILAIRFSYLGKLYTNRNVLILLSLVSAILVLPNLLLIIKAESLRISMLAYRSSSIESQQLLKVEKVVVEPAPILLEDSQAYDLDYRDQSIQYNWWALNILKEYYGLSNIDINTKQPKGYCLHNQSRKYLNILSCADLGATQPY